MGFSMLVDRALYHGWEGRLRPRIWTVVTLTKVSLAQLWRRKSFWFLLALGLLNFVMYFSIIYAVTQLELPSRAQDNLMSRFGFRPDAESGHENGYVSFMTGQGQIVTLLLAFAGSLLVGSDFRLGLIPFYRSRGLRVRHIVWGKLIAMSTIVAALTLFPAILLFVEYGLFSASHDYWWENWRILVSIVLYGTILSGTLAVGISAISAYLQKMAPIAITWISLFVVPRIGATQMSRATDNRMWLLLDPWRDIRYAGRWAFQTYSSERQEMQAGWAILILSVLTLLGLWAFRRKVRSAQ